jgi:hypothetical protein
MPVSVNRALWPPVRGAAVCLTLACDGGKLHFLLHLALLAPECEVGHKARTDCTRIERATDQRLFRVNVELVRVLPGAVRMTEQQEHTRIQLRSRRAGFVRRCCDVASAHCDVTRTLVCCTSCIVPHSLAFEHMAHLLPSWSQPQTCELLPSGGLRRSLFALTHGMRAIEHEAGGDTCSAHLADVMVHVHLFSIAVPPCGRHSCAPTGCGPWGAERS